MNISTSTSREIAIIPNQAALLFIDIQNYCSRPDGGEFRDLDAATLRHDYSYYFDRLATVTIPNMQRLQRAARCAGVEIMYTVIESLTLDGRDRGLDYKITGFNVPRGSWDAKVLESIAPQGDEIVIPKTSSSVFMSTNIDYVLRSLGARQLILCGGLTDQCVESAVRDACDLNYLVTLVPDCCATYSEARHTASLAAIKGYCRQIDTDALIAELAGL